MTYYYWRIKFQFNHNVTYLNKCKFLITIQSKQVGKILLSKHMTNPLHFTSVVISWEFMISFIARLSWFFTFTWACVHQQGLKWTFMIWCWLLTHQWLLVHTATASHKSANIKTDKISSCRSRAQQYGRVSDQYTVFQQQEVTELMVEFCQTLTNF